ncbi:MAG: helix-turn-helix transcriptional regulator [Clostridia bacterium]|nr:helix-turn-helix transcriptional regulator [Clostridia bacterium]
MNRDIKDMIKAAGLHQYQVADLCGVSETTLVRWLRYELTPEKREMILSAIEKGGQEDGAGRN